MFTASLKTDYLSPVAAPGFMLAVAKVTFKDKTVDICTTAKAVFVMKREAKV